MMIINRDGTAHTTEMRPRRGLLRWLLHLLRGEHTS
jgi:hypothetical protein